MHILFPKDLTFFQHLVLQRTTPFIRIGGSEPLKYWLDTGKKEQLTNFLLHNNLFDLYIKELIEEISNEVNQLILLTKDASFKNIVSIGPGCGLMELIYYSQKKFNQILLVDIEESSLHQHSFNSEGSGYASLEKTKFFLISNGIPEEKIILCNPKKTILPKFEFDLLMSFISMGFHYPCNDYVDFILRNINNEGKVILDKRIGAPDPGFFLLSESLEIENQIKFGKRIRTILRTKSR